MHVHTCEFVHVHLSVRFLSLNKGTNGDTWQTYVGLWGSAEIDGITVQANILKSIADVIQVMWIAEGVLMHHLDIVILNGKKTCFQCSIQNICQCSLKSTMLITRMTS